MDRDWVPEARLTDTDSGRKAQDSGWFVVNAADASAMGTDDGNYAILFEGQLGTFPHFGINLRVLDPGSPAAYYHAESGQEAFLVVQGECMLIVEEQERRLRQWDFVHCPPHTAHVIVGAGDAPCIVLMVGARNVGHDLVFPVSEAAGRYGASATHDTTDPREAYASLKAPPRPGRFRWPPAGSSSR
jgi:uncharacterized cupin superfamily protein